MSAACPVFGFVLRAQPPIARELLARLRAGVLEPRGLVLTDGERAGEYIVTGDGFQATDADRDAVIAWHRRAAVAQRFDVGPLADVGSAA